jgi:multiple sugar transport system ATP-binding protein
MNFVEGSIAEDGVSLVLDGLGGERVPLGRKLEPGRKVIVGMRPENLALVPEPDANFHVQVGTVESTGSLSYLSSVGEVLTIVQTDRTGVRPGDRIGLKIDPRLVHLFDHGTEVRIA